MPNPSVPSCLAQNGDTALDVAERLQKRDVAAKLRAAMASFARADPLAPPPGDSTPSLNAYESVTSVHSTLPMSSNSGPSAVFCASSVSHTEAARLPAPSHRPAPKGAVWVAAACGDLLGLENELANGGSTEEEDEVRRARFVAKRGNNWLA